MERDLTAEDSLLFNFEKYKYLGNPFDDAMDDVYISCNAANILLYLAPISLPTIILGTAWNLIDSCGAFILAYQEGRNHDPWAQGINALSGIQLLTGTIASLLLNPDIVFIGLHASLGLSIIAASASSFAFAAAMFFSLALEHHKVKLCRAEIDKLNIPIKETLSRLGNFLEADKFKDIQDEREKISFLKTFLENLRKEKLIENEDLIKLLESWHYQQQKLEIHERARRAWGLCAVFMTVVAIVSVVITVLGLSILTGGIAMALASSVALLGSALYRQKDATNTIKNVYSFFKPQPTAHNQDDNFIPTNNNLRPAGF